MPEGRISGSKVRKEARPILQVKLDFVDMRGKRVWANGSQKNGSHM